MSREQWRDPIPRGGLVASLAAGTRARFGYWPADFISIVQRCLQGRIPPHVETLARTLASSRPWERCEHGEDLTADHPLCRKCIT